MKLDKERIKQEKQLVARCVKGNKKAWDELVDKYKNLIYSAIIRTFQSVGHANPEEAADDIFQGVFASLLKDNCAKLRKFKWKNGCSLASWILIISKSRTFDYLRKVFSRKKIMTPLIENAENEEDVFKDARYAEGSFLEELEHKERVGLFKRALKELPKDDICLVELIYFRGFSHERAAKVMKKTKDSIYVQKRRMIEKLKNIIKKYT